MILGIRTDTATATLILHDGKSEIGRHVWEAGRQLSSELLSEIEKLLQKHDCNWEKLQGVVVFQGPGSFTGLRIGVTVANAVAYSQNIPIAGVVSGEWFADGVSMLKSGTNHRQVTPEYGAPANITKPRSAS
jgi:tRNA threonylcarbamoyladenosine biosynthesis protein TsaB